MFILKYSLFKNYNNSQFILELPHTFKCDEYLLKCIALVIRVPTHKNNVNPQVQTSNGNLKNEPMYLPAF